MKTTGTVTTDTTTVTITTTEYTTIRGDVIRHAEIQAHTDTGTTALDTDRFIDWLYEFKYNYYNNKLEIRKGDVKHLKGELLC